MIWLRILGLLTLRRLEELFKRTRFSKLSQYQGNCQVWLLPTILGWRWMLCAAHRESIRRAMQVPTRQIKRKSTSYWTSLPGLALRRMRVALDFIAPWRWHAKAKSSTCSKGLLREKSLIDHADRMDSDTIRSLFQTAPNEPLVSLNLRKKIN